VILAGCPAGHQPMTPTYVMMSYVSSYDTVSLDHGLLQIVAIDHDPLVHSGT
jgi:hypothetical protein